MKRYAVIVITTLLIFNLAGCTKATNTQVNNAQSSQKGEINKKPAVKKPAKEFALEDTEILGIKLDSEQNALEKALGKPLKVESQYEEAFGADVLTYYYDFGEVRLEPLDQQYAVSYIWINQPGFAGPRKTLIGDSVEELLEKFPQDKNAVVDENGVKYLYGMNEDNSGLVNYDPQGQINSVSYKIGGDGFGSCFLTFEIENGKIKSIASGVINI